MRLWQGQPNWLNKLGVTLLRLNKALYNRKPTYYILSGQLSDLYDLRLPVSQQVPVKDGLSTVNESTLQWRG